ncbi:hypothetical protein JR316_0012143 [Psilocybe cubensis]|uniref:Uncharacterized protein n=2 Tax=Psilocybe cubensis TaxID=181762 RepID=A0ACB8GHA6_PSICU|nr:hypothetical protein JR316_0012143 [Psilocybe cubensis]KAH9475041.1 hypothetical protein JR316_0012143 [Psilocybe cubensis]
MPLSLANPPLFRFARGGFEMGNESFPIDAAQVVAVFMESVFYGKFPYCVLWVWLDVWRLGIYLVSFFACIRVLLWIDGWFKPLHLINRKMLFAALLMFLFASLDVAFHLRHNLEAFVYFDAHPIETFEQTSNWINVMKMVCYVAQTFVGDSILVSAYVLWGLQKLVNCGSSHNSLAGNYGMRDHDYLHSIHDGHHGRKTAQCVQPRSVHHEHAMPDTRDKPAYNLSSAVQKSPLTSVLVVLIESGLMYTMSIVILFGLYMASNNGQYGVSNAVVQIIGITFNLIITSVDRGEAMQPTSGAGRISHLTPQESQGGVPLHMINIQTTVSRFPDSDLDVTPTKSNGEIDVENGSSKRGWSAETHG